VAGSATDTNGLFTVKGSGANIWGAADTFFYVYQPATNNYTISAKVLSVQNTGSHAKGGVMIRETTATNSTLAMVDITPSAGVEFVWRTTTGGTAASAVVSGITAPNWVQVTRSGSNFTGYYSTNGATWIPLATNTITMATNAYVGLPVCAYDNATNCTATFTNVVLTP
jgi:regulation of enolase protein 1 (concanavalin A-like superfamily)